MAARRGIALLLAGMAALAAGCGEDSEAKRTVDPRSEALRFLPVDAEIAIIAEPNAGATLARLLGGPPLLGIEAGGIVQFLERAEIGPAALSSLTEEADPEDDIDPPELVIGVADIRNPRPLLILAGEQEDAVEEYFDRRVAAGLSVEAGELHDAALFRGRGVHHAIRDGVIVAAPSRSALEQAIELRDGDRDKHLDDRAAEDVIEEVPEEAPVHAYLNLAELVEGRAGLSRLAERQPWIAALGDGAISVAPRGTGFRISGFAELDRADLSEEDLPAGNEPVSFGPVPLFPAAGLVSATTDELRINAVGPTLGL